jgi:hypothetical protein
MEPPKPKSVDRAQLHYILDYILLGKRRRLQTGTNPSPEIPQNKIKKNWPSHDIELLGMQVATRAAVNMIISNAFTRSTVIRMFTVTV